MSTQFTIVAHLVAKPGKIEGTLATTPSAFARLDFFASPKGGTQGKRFLGLVLAGTDANGNLSFSFKPNQPVKTGQRITATATTSDDGTSEFSKPKKVV